MEDIYPYSFEGPVERFGIGKTRKVWYNVLFLTDELSAVLPFDEHPRLGVEGEICDIPIENAFIPAGDGRNYVIISPSTMKDAGLEQGDIAEIRFRIADQNHVDIPYMLQDQLNANDGDSALWGNLTPGRKRMLAQHVHSAKTAPTAIRRVSEVIAALRGYEGNINAWRKASR